MRGVTLVFNVAFLKMAVNAGVHAFDALQQVFEADESGEGISVAMPAGEVNTTEIDFFHHPAPSQAVADWMRRRMNTSIDINAGHLFDFAVLKVEEEKYYLLTKFRHLVIDGIGIAIFSRFISDKYNSLLNGEEMPPVTNTFRGCVDDYFASFDESFGWQQLTYQELDKRTTQVAAWLRHPDGITNNKILIFGNDDGARLSAGLAPRFKSYRS